MLNAAALRPPTAQAGAARRPRQEIGSSPRAICPTLREPQSGGFPRRLKT
jgi:hypothetical protein